jgi:hypothetical protein
MALRHAAVFLCPQEGCHAGDPGASRLWQIAVMAQYMKAQVCSLALPAPLAPDAARAAHDAARQLRLLQPL